jgi:hypothetical protein
LNKDKSYSAKGYLNQVSGDRFVIFAESIQSILVDSVLNNLTLDKSSKKEIKNTLNGDTLFFSNDYKSFIYNKHEFKMIEKPTTTNNGYK